MATRTDTKTGRFYEVDGQRLPSVTTILSVINKPALVNWAANQERAAVIDAAADLYLDVAKTPPMSRPAYVATLTGRIGKQKAHQRELAKAAEIGTQAHAIIEWNLRKALDQKVGPEPKILDAALWAYMAFTDWAQSVSLKPLHIEQMVFSLEHSYAGTMDLLAEVNGVPTLIDFKTGKAIYAEAYLQNVAYQVALAEMGHAAAKAGIVVRLPKVDTDPAFEVGQVLPVAELFPVFLHVKGAWHWWHVQEVAYQAKREAEKVVEVA